MYDEKFYKNVETLYKSDDYIFVKIPINVSFIILGLVYISPLREIEPILEEIEEIITIIYNKYGNSKLIIGGTSTQELLKKEKLTLIEWNQNRFTARKEEVLIVKYTREGMPFWNFASEMTYTLQTADFQETAQVTSHL